MRERKMSRIITLNLDNPRDLRWESQMGISVSRIIAEKLIYFFEFPSKSWMENLEVLMEMLVLIGLFTCIRATFEQQHLKGKTFPKSSWLIGESWHFNDTNWVWFDWNFGNKFNELNQLNESLIWLKSQKHLNWYS